MTTNELHSILSEAIAGSVSESITITVEINRENYEAAEDYLACESEGDSDSVVITDMADDSQYVDYWSEDGWRLHLRIVG